MRERFRPANSANIDKNVDSACGRSCNLRDLRHFRKCCVLAEIKQGRRSLLVASTRRLWLRIRHFLKCYSLSGPGLTLSRKADRLSGLFGVHVQALRDGAEHVVGISLLVDGLSQEFSGCAFAENLSETPNRAVRCNFKVLDTLRGGYQRHIADYVVSRVEEHVFSLFDQGVNRLALDEFDGAGRGHQNSLKPQHMLFRLLFNVAGVRLSILDPQPSRSCPERQWQFAPRRKEA